MKVPAVELRNTPTGLNVYVDGQLYVKAPTVLEAQQEEVFEKFLVEAQRLFTENKPMDVVARKFMAACRAHRGGAEFDASMTVKDVARTAHRAGFEVQLRTEPIPGQRTKPKSKRRRRKP